VTNRPPHLTDDATHVLARPASERIYFIRLMRWLPYARAQRMLDEPEQLLLHPRTTLITLHCLALTRATRNANIAKFRAKPCALPFGERLEQASAGRVMGYAYSAVAWL
jgi:hypothetical protein